VVVGGRGGAQRLEQLDRELKWSLEIRSEDPVPRAIWILRERLAARRFSVVDEQIQSRNALARLFGQDIHASSGRQISGDASACPQCDNSSTARPEAFALREQIKPRLLVG
jgi:hypothetical protein